MSTDRPSKLHAPLADASAACELPSDSELLDQLDIDAELANFSQDPFHGDTTIASASTAPFKPANVQQNGSTLFTPTPPRSFLIGGSLFELRPASLPHLPRLPRRCGSPVVSTVASAVFCPFTHQFVSLSSPHWDHLHSAGFGVSPDRHGTSRVQLRDVARLRGYARSLQACSNADAERRADTGVPSAALVRREQLFRSWRWSSSLQHTLGTVLSVAPLNSLQALKAAVERELLTKHNYDAARVIKAAAESAREVAADGDPPWRTRWKDLQCPVLEVDGGASLLAEGNEARAVIRWADDPHSTASESLPVEGCAGQRPPCAASVCSSSVLPAWTRRYTERRCLPLLGLPADVRAALLEIPFAGEVDAPPLMPPVCAAVLTRLAQELAEVRREGLHSARPKLYYCPLAHGVDYNGVLDLRAFQVALRDDSTSEHTPRAVLTSLSEGRAHAAEATPVLSLGMESLDGSGDDDDGPAAAPPLRVVVFDNAHLLSKRAISRLLDQWTRNGSAAQRHRELRAAQGYKLQQSGSAGGAEGARRITTTSSRHWQTLMGSQVPVGSALPSLRTLAPPFGDVQAVFLSYRPQEAGEKFSAKSSTTVLHDAPRQSGPQHKESDNSVFSVSVCPEPRSDLLYVEESLAAALLRVSALCRLRLSAPQRKELLEGVVRCALGCAGDDVPCVKRVSKRLPSGKTVAESLQFRLGTPRGQALLYEACEAVLALLSPLDAFLEGAGSDGMCQADQTVRVLTTYPTLTTLRLRHVLLSVYHLRVTQLATATAPASTEAGAEVPKGDTAASAHKGSAKQPRVSFLTSKQAAYAREAQEQQQLLRRARVRAATVAASSSCSSLLPSFARPLLFSQTYSLYPEPPVLLGRWWTATLLFCTPTLADVVSLRSFLLDSLRRRRHPLSAHKHRRHHHCSAFDMQRDGDAVSEGELAELRRMEVEDVDVFHTDIGANAPRCRANYRVFGVRALARFAAPTAVEPRCWGATNRTAAMAWAVRELEQQLQRCLKRCASKAVLFPLWTYRGAGRSAEDADAAASASSNAPEIATQGDRSPTGQHSCSQSSGGRGLGGPAAAFPSFQYATLPCSPPRHFPDFNTVREWHTLWIPALVERRLFTLAVAQKPSMVLTVGARVVLQEAVRVPGKGSGGGGQDSSSSSLTTDSYPRGCVCRVVGFVTVEKLFAEDTASPPSSLPPSIQRQVEGWTSAERLQVRRYVEQQRGASALPLLTCVWNTCPHRSDEAFLLTPRPSLIGGYRSTHYYGLPVLHLPVCVLIGDSHGCQRAHTGRVNRRAHRTEGSTPSPSPLPTSLRRPSGSSRTFLTSTSPKISFDFVLTDVFHPYHADLSNSMSALCLTHAERATAHRLLFTLMTHRSSSQGGPPDAVASQTEATAPIKDRPSHSPVSFMEDVLFYDSAELSPQNAVNAADTAATSSTEPIKCPLVTELALYARVRSLE
ncbi:hypothetical protein ABB37_02480 [Leptomonas pyrrhocoris]|uniref:Uncharacterized protein n=1 Tax=Leptomonas pyrrhocoris TaxID=157538 RepID=A0A0N1J520_LEPPY|nr:hypothetical protein ABB37_02480 [Leptomonas pyrrhocoris]KPA82641.1 hypothetical protein ABB37_02480 [Leptomonas pyrrhocoris]|eukprot:XP_015661080.1 hypothetical protein ABB37_02480 [Leptomonas pyrrhocoris]